MPTFFKTISEKNSGTGWEASYYVITIEEEIAHDNKYMSGVYFPTKIEADNYAKKLAQDKGYLEK